jgi:hypothetical protein
MGKVILDMTLYLEGSIAGPHDETNWGLFDWQFDSKTNLADNNSRVPR